MRSRPGAVDVTALRRLAAFAHARPCCSGLRASLCCPAWQLLLWLRFVNLNKDTIIIIYPHVVTVEERRYSPDRRRSPYRPSGDDDDLAVFASAHGRLRTT